MALYSVNWAAKGHLIQDYVVVLPMNMPLKGEKQGGARQSKREFHACNEVEKILCRRPIWGSY